LKRLIPYFLYVTLFSKTLTAQIVFTVTSTNVHCNTDFSELGSISVTVTPTNPPYIYLWTDGQKNPTITNLTEGGVYTLYIADGLGEDTTISIEITKCEMGPAVVFTPNDDGYKDTWSISNSQFYPNARVLIYNRLGQMIFDHKGLYEPWDGKDLFGVPVPESSYFYIIYPDKSDQKTIQKGAVSVIR
jgi:gliding motility-associated-like protein